ncbi:hypothetical protein EVAR_38395_1 [Eumeta japonica]|uniref:Uncharacterized protein n=1 Tax=Eumeta variegata TaxID=151549 RepID=A0A4C1YG32_EUMVA|nr:hypothetical protein EVAR_38395_1 [Eumeta japonica]
MDFYFKRIRPRHVQTELATECDICVEGERVEPAKEFVSFGSLFTNYPMNRLYGTEQISHLQQDDNLDFQPSFFVAFSRSEQVRESLESRWSPTPMNTRNSKGLTSALPAFWVAIRYLTEDRMD